MEIKDVHTIHSFVSIVVTLCWYKIRFALIMKCHGHKSIAVTRVQLGLGSQGGRTCLLRILSLLERRVSVICSTCPPSYSSLLLLVYFFHRPVFCLPALLGHQVFLSDPEMVELYPCLQHYTSTISLLTFFDLSTNSVTALNISSTLILSLADVSNSLIPIWSANLLASSVRTTFNRMIVTWCHLY